MAKHPPSLVIGQKSGGGAIYRELVLNSIHVLDAMRWLFGDAQCVAASSIAQPVERETAIAALLSFSSGAEGIYMMSREAGRWIEEVQVHGDGYTAELAAPNQLKISHKGNMTVWKPDGDRWMMSFHDKFGFTEEVKAFLQAVKDEKPFPITLTDGLATYKLVDEILQHAGLPGLHEAQVPDDGGGARIA